MSDPAAFTGAGFHLECRKGGHLLQALSRAFGADLTAPLTAIAEPAPHSVRRAGPDSWFIVGETTLSEADVARRGDKVRDVAWLIDQSSGRCRLVLSGPASERRLARGIGADLSARRFGIGGATETQYAGIGLHLTRVAIDRFEILVGRSFAESLWEELAN